MARHQHVAQQVGCSEPGCGAFGCGNPRANLGRQGRGARGANPPPLPQRSVTYVPSSNQRYHLAENDGFPREYIKDPPDIQRDPVIHPEPYRPPPLRNQSISRDVLRNPKGDNIPRPAQYPRNDHDPETFFYGDATEPIPAGHIVIPPLKFKSRSSSRSGLRSRSRSRSPRSPKHKQRQERSPVDRLPMRPSSDVPNIYLPPKDPDDDDSVSSYVAYAQPYYQF